MSDIFDLNAELRTDHGKAAARRMRHEGKVPAVIYGAGKEPQAITLMHNEMIHALGNEAIYSHILKIHIDNKKESVVLKDIQRHAYKPKVLHVDFLRVKATEALIMQVPIHFLGEEEAPGIKEGGVVSKLMTEVEVKCLPADLPESIELDISNMALDQTLHLSDLSLPKGVELTIAELDEEHDHPVVSVHVPRVTKADIEAEAAEAEAAEEAAAEAAAEAEGAGEEAKEEASGEEQAPSDEAKPKE